jgi:ferredoxin/flavodoxin
LEDNKSNRAVIFYFSGTGNTWWVSEELAKALTRDSQKVKAYSIEALTAHEADQLIQHADLTGFGYPIHGSDIPLPMKRFIDQLPQVQNKSAFVFCTQWLWSGDGAAIGAAMLEEKGYSVYWGEHFYMPNNVSVSIIRLPYTNKPARLNSILNRTGQKIKHFGNRIASGKTFRKGFNPIARFMGSLQRRPYRHFYHKLQNDIDVDRNICIDCGECVRLCPVDNLYYDGSLIKTRGTCVICLRCYSFCPVAAITYMGKAHLQNRGEPYRGPISNFDPGILINQGEKKNS